MCIFQPPKMTPAVLPKSPELAAAPPAPPNVATADGVSSARKGRNALRIDLAGPGAGNTSLGPTGLNI